MGPDGAITVASVPAGHPYVRHLARPGPPDPVVRLPDPPPLADDPRPGQWWPPAMLDPGWVRRHAGQVDLMHLHFGFDASRPAELRRWVAELREQRIPLVLTVHDLTNPHFVDQRDHLANLDALVPAADAVLTLTGAAGDRIRRRWGVAATVVPHPHVVPLDHPVHTGRPRTTAHGDPAAAFVIALHVKNLRANVDPLPVLAALRPALAALPGAVVQVHLHPELRDRTDQRAVALLRFLDGCADDPRFRVAVHPPLPDDDLFAALAAVDLLVLPYRFGTHSGWLEVCADLGTGVLVPDVGCFADQHGHPTYHREPDSVDPARLAQVLVRIRENPQLAAPPVPDRRSQRTQIAIAHERVYREALARA